MSAAATSTNGPLERYRSAFEQRWVGDDALTAVRRAALQRFLDSGFPTQRDEAWKYTNLRRFESRQFTPAPAPSAVLASNAAWLRAGGSRIVFVDGHWIASLSALAPLPPGVTLLTLGRWAEREPAQVAELLTTLAPLDAKGLQHLNLAFSEDGLLLDLAPGAQLDEPIYIVHQSSAPAESKPRMSHPRVIVRAGAGSTCTVIEHFVGADAEYFTNALTTVTVGTGGSVTHYRLQGESARAFHLAHVDVRLEADARYRSYDAAFGGSLARVGIGTRLAGKGAHASLKGLFAPFGAQHIDTHTRIDHLAAHTTSDEEYRGVAAGKGRGVFNGKVIVHPDAQKIDARQSSRNLLLSATAEIDTRPELEIYAHDVKCSHGATTGQLDATSLFYLRSRGLSLQQARVLLIRAFAESVLTAIDSSNVRSWFEAQLDERFSTLPEIL